VEVMMVTRGMIYPGQAFKPTGEDLTVPAGDFLLGRAINPLGIPIDGKKPLPKDKNSLVPLETPIPGVADRRFIREQLETGITLIDSLVPLGKGQRELVIGDARSGKTGFIMDIIANQKNRKMICIYACVAKPATDVFDLVKALDKNGCMAYTVVVASFSLDSSPLIFLTPKTALSIATYFQRQGKDVLVIIDDIGSHAKIYREISLLADRPPGREAYPGDIFYEHAHLMERAGNFASSVGGGSISALPVMELGMTNFSGFIPTNLMSMTDGHLLFSSTLFSQGRRPAIDLSLSVSRVGQQTQCTVQTELASKIKSLLIEAERLIALTSFSAELPPETRALFSRKNVIMEILHQNQSENVPLRKQIITLALPLTKMMDGKEEKYISAFRGTVLAAFDNNKKLIELADAVFEMSGVDELLTKLNDLLPGLMQSVQGTMDKLAKPGDDVSVKSLLGDDVPTPNLKILEKSK
ncbi:hypothetical protein HY310_01260, partial [Candidatus Microgenomates bacterium]|nr:hypothetical protein [Candidatus Microgenomates bacterium]